MTIFDHFDRLNFAPVFTKIADRLREFFANNDSGTMSIDYSTNQRSAYKAIVHV